MATKTAAAPITLVVMLGDEGPTFPEQVLGQVREAIALDTVETGLEMPLVRQVVVSTRRASFMRRLAGLPVQVIPDPADVPFHFGERLHEVVALAGAEQVFYIGGGAGPLLRRPQFEGLIAALAEAPNRLVTNNLYSSDMVGFPAGLLDRIELPNKDNDLAWRLAQLGGLDVRQPPRAAAIAFDVDTITDIVILTLCRGMGRHTERVVRDLNLDTHQLQEATRCLTDPAATLLLAGRASSSVWQTLEQRARCTTRVIAEERGMRASGRLARGEVRSLMGFAIEQFGFDGFFQRLAQIADAALIDSRVLFAHLGPWPSDADRCYSDLSRPAEIEDEKIRRLTEAAMSAPLPVVLGGHSLLSGGILALLEGMGL